MSVVHCSSTVSEMLDRFTTPTATTAAASSTAAAMPARRRPLDALVAREPPARAPRSGQPGRAREEHRRPQSPATASSSAGPSAPPYLARVVDVEERPAASATAPPRASSRIPTRRRSGA